MLKGNEIRLRALEPHDVELLYRWENDPAIWTISHTLTPFSQFTLKQYIASSAQDIYTSKQLRLMIDELHNRKTIGVIDIFDFDPFHRRAGVGILIDAQYRQMHYATEAIALIKEYMFNVLQLHQIYCNILADNEASLTLFTHAGFEIIGNKKEWILTSNGYQDELMLQCIKPSRR